MFKVICPHCKKEFECEMGGISLHCYDYRTKDGKQFAAAITDNITQCVECGKEFNLEECSTKENYGEVNDGSVAES